MADEPTTGRIVMASEVSLAPAYLVEVLKALPMEYDQYDAEGLAAAAWGAVLANTRYQTKDERWAAFTFKELDTLSSAISKGLPPILGDDLYNEIEAELERRRSP